MVINMLHTMLISIKKNNHPSNLLRMTAIEHSSYHRMLADNGKLLLQRNDIKEKRMLGIDKYLRSEKRKVKLSKEMSGIYPKYFNDYNNSPLHEKHNKVRTNNMLEHWSNNEYREMVKDKMQLKIDDVCLNYIIKVLTNSRNYVSAENLGKILLGQYRIGPCTAMAVMELLESTKVNLYGKEAVIVGHSEIVGKPLSLMLLNKFATTTVCHIGTGERGTLPDHVKRAEVLVAAVGKAGIIKGGWIKEGAIVIDVGINRVADKIVGDVEFEAAEKRASWITPVPGGVGPLTVTMLMRNLVEAAKSQE